MADPDRLLARITDQCYTGDIEADVQIRDLAGEVLAVVIEAAERAGKPPEEMLEVVLEGLAGEADSPAPASGSRE